jgi:hypothetical protein
MDTGYVIHTVLFQVVLLALTSTVLGHGLAASQFSHDVASPVTVMRTASEELDMLLDACPTRDTRVRVALASLAPEGQRRTQELFTSGEASTRQVLRDLDGATTRTMRMTGSQGVSVGHPGRDLAGRVAQG